MGIVCFRLSTMKTIIILIVASLAFAEDYDYPTVDENCSDPCCTLQVTRPDDENVEKYSGVYKKKGGHKDENGGVNGYPKYVKQGTNGTVWMQVSIGYGSDYEDFPNWGIMDDNRRYGLDWPAVEGGWQGDSPVGDWPNGGKATCIKYNKKKTVCRKFRYEHEPGVNGIYDKLTGSDDMGWQSWKQRDNFQWVFSFNEYHEEQNVHEGGFSRYSFSDYFDDYSDDKSGGQLEGTWTDGTSIECIKQD